MAPKYDETLQKIREEFQRFPLESPPRRRHLAMAPGETSQLLAHALLYLCDSLKIERAAVFLLDESSQTLQAQQLVVHGDEMPGEEQLAVLPDSPLNALLAGKKDYLMIQGPLNTAFIPLRAFGKV